MTFIEMSIASIVLIIGIVLIRALFLNKLPKITFPILWGIVFIRLALPFSFSVPNNAISDPLSLNAILLQPFTTASPSSSTLLSVDTTYNFYAPAVHTLAQESNLLQFISSINWLMLLWIAGSVATLSVFMISYFKTSQKLKCAVANAKCAIANAKCAVANDDEFLQKWKIDHKLRRPIEILFSKNITTPLTLGLLKPKILLPAQMDLRDRDKLQYILSHELLHIKRGDILWKFLAMFILCLHWFNPFVWVAFILANRDLEISCDAWVIKQFGAKTKKAYAQALLALAEHQNGFSPLYSSFSRYAVEERIVSVMKNKKTTTLSLIVAICVVGLLSFNAFANASVENNYDTISESYYDTDSLDDESGAEVEVQVIDVVESVSGVDTEDEEEFGGTVPTLSNLREISVGGMTVKAGDLFSRYNAYLGFDYDHAVSEIIPMEDAAAIMVQGAFEHHQLNSDGLILDIFPMVNYEGEYMWVGFLLSSDYDPTVRMPVTGYVPSNEQIHFSIVVCGLTGEISAFSNTFAG